MTLVNLFDPWKSEICTCPEKYSLSPYTGCGHGCLYCYASSYVPRFFSPRIKKDFHKRISKELNNIPQTAILTIANSSDPYQPLEKKYRLMNYLLKNIKEFNFNVMIVTKSDLVVRDLNLLRDLKAIVAISLTTLDRFLAKRIEPGAPLPISRLKAVETLSSSVPVICRFDPLIYPLNTSEIEKLVRELKERGVRQIITSTYKAKPDNFKRMTGAFPEHKELWEKLYLKQGERLSGYYYLSKKIRKHLIEEVRDVALSYGLDFTSCREGFEVLNTSSCDGSSMASSFIS